MTLKKIAKTEYLLDTDSLPEGWDGGTHSISYDMPCGYVSVSVRGVLVRLDESELIQPSDALQLANALREAARLHGEFVALFGEDEEDSD